MDTLRFDLSRGAGKFKILNATNGGPWHKRHTSDQSRSNMADYKAARIPYSRNHDSGVVGIYGGPYSHDITRIFPNFDADVTDPASYDFACTDESILCTLDAGTETFFRLGQTIEHQIKKHGTLPPKDFYKWAQICEHIILHYNHGWADGFELGIKYWEIWNEPDLDLDDSTNKRTWGGTQAQFFDLYEITARYLKSRFPELMIGGPALAYREEWADTFLSEMKRREVPIDFFSWHVYCNEPNVLAIKSERIKALLEKNGYGNAESILNEWNYANSKGWGEGAFGYTVMTIHGIKGAAFIMSVISAAQKADGIDMLMYYDTRPSVFCGAFDFYSGKPLKGYYPLMWYGKFYDMKEYIPCENDVENIYTLCGTDENGKILCVVTHYSDDDGTPPANVKLDFGREGNFEVFLLDSERDGEPVGTTDKTEFNMKCHSCILLKEI